MGNVTLPSIGYFNSQMGIRGTLVENSAAGNAYTSDQLFQGVWRLDQNNIAKFDPFLTGYAFFIWMKPPVFMTKLGNKDGKIWQNFKSLTEKNFKEFGGLSDMTLGSEDVTMGFAGNTIAFPTNMPKENTTFTLTHQELQGSPIREGYNLWTTGIRDHDTGLATYHGLINTSSDLRYSMKNHTAEAIYVVTDPSGASLYGSRTGTAPSWSIEFACYITNMFPTKNPMEHFNYTAGDHAFRDISEEFRGTIHLGQHVNDLAKRVMNDYAYKSRYHDYAAYSENEHKTGYDETLSSTSSTGTNG